MAENILFVLVRQKKQELKSSKLLQAPRSEYAAAVEKHRQTSMYYAEAAVELDRLPDADGPNALEGCVLETAVDSYLARELLQKGPADAQGHTEDDEEDVEKQPGQDERREGDAVLRIPPAWSSSAQQPGQDESRMEDDVLRNPSASSSAAQESSGWKQRIIAFDAVFCVCVVCVYRRVACHQATWSPALSA